MKMKHVLMLGICALMLMGCSGGARSAGDPFKFLSDLGVNVNEDLILGDSLTLNDIYCGDKGQSSSELPGVELSREQYEALIVPAGRDFISEMSLTLPRSSYQDDIKGRATLPRTTDADVTTVADGGSCSR